MNEWPDFQIPTEWSLTRMDELATKLKAGGTPSRQNKANFGGDIPFVLIDDMTSSGVYLKSTKETITRGGLESCSAWIVPENTVLLSMYATIGATVITTFPVATNQAILAIIPREDCDRVYLSFCLQAHKRHLARLNVESTQKNINKGIVSSFPLPLPPLPEQKKIAHILSTVQRAIEAQERIIQTTTELKKALMHKLFTEGLRHEPQKQTEIGPVPESWEVVELNQLADLKNGYAFKSTDYIAESNTLNIRMSNIRPGAQFDLEYNPRFLPDHFAETQKSFLLEDGDLIIAMTDMANDPKILGVPTIVRNPSEKKLLLNQRVGKLVPTDSRRVNLEFLRFYLSRKPAQSYLVSCAKKGVQVNIGKKDILSVPIAFPKPDEQKTIVECFNTLGEKVAAAENKVVALQDLFRTLLHELMTAKTRVHELEIAA